MSTFHSDYMQMLSDDEHALLYAILNNNKSVRYSVQHSIAENVLEKLKRVKLNEEGEKVRNSIIEKYERFVESPAAL